MGRTRRPAVVGLLAALSVLLAAPVTAGVVEVQVQLPSPQKIETGGMKRLLVGGFRTNDHPTVDLDRELNRALRNLFAKGTSFEVLDVDPLPLPEQPIEEAIRNTAYWKRLGERFNADLIVGGTLRFESSDRSGFIEEDVISQLTGQRMRRSRWAEREGFTMDLGLYLFRGSSGELLYEDHFTEETVFDGKANDDLSVLFQLVDRVRESVLGIITPRTRLEMRYLFTE